jgi:serine/threonine protein phosphatase PrpC
MVVVFSDGVLDLYDDALEAIEAVADRAVALGAPDALVDSIAADAHSRHLPDDVTVVAVQRRPSDRAAQRTDDVHLGRTR